MLNFILRKRRRETIINYLMRTTYVRSERMKNFLIDYIEEIVFFIALVLISISAYFVNISLGFFINGLVLLAVEYKIKQIKKEIARKG